MFDKQLFKFLVFVLIGAVFFAGCSLVRPVNKTANQSGNFDFSSLEDRQLIPLQIGNHQLTVEVVNTPASLTQGLGGRDSIGSDGMLFVLPQRQVAGFWMGGMRIPLDFVWIDGNQIIGLLENVPAPTDPNDSELPTHSSNQPVTAVLELNAGRISQLGLTVGDKLKN